MKGCLTAGSDSYFYLVLNYSRPDAFLHGVWYSHILKLYVLIGAYGYYLGHWMWASRFVHLTLFICFLLTMRFSPDPSHHFSTCRQLYHSTTSHVVLGNCCTSISTVSLAPTPRLPQFLLISYQQLQRAPSFSWYVSVDLLD